MMKKILLFSIICSLLMAVHPLMAQEDTFLLFKYAKEGNVAGIRKLINEGVDVNQQDRSGNTVLMVAADHGRTEVVRELLLTPGIEVNAASLMGRTPLVEAVRSGQTAIVRLLLGSPEIDMNQVGWLGRTPLMWAVIYKNPVILGDLLNAGADSSLENLRGQTALSFAIEKRFKYGIKALVKAGADYEPYIEVPPVQETLRELFGTSQRLLEREIGGRIQPRRFGAPQLLESGSVLGKRKRLSTRKAKKAEIEN